jgi:glyoxylase-like metal-dependent hydrolase (beta-lactamase superfamily II)
MFFRRLIDADLGCVSYVIADAGEAIVVDPASAIDQYLELARRHHFGIAHIVETHPRADAASGTRALVELTAATAYRPLRPCDSVAVGGVLLTARTTSGHRPRDPAFALRTVPCLAI